jgi:O-antigen ligase
MGALPPVPELLVRLLLFVAGCAVALGIGLLVGAGSWEIGLGLAIGVPALAIVIRYPFAGVLVWLLVIPFFVRQASTEANPILIVIHRIGLPSLLVLIATLHLLGLRRRTFRFHAIDACLVLFLALGVFNVLFLSPNPARMMVSFADKVAIPITLFWIIRAIAPGRRELAQLVAVGAWTIAIQATIGVLTWIAPSALPAQWLGRAGERTTGTLGGPAPYTITLVFFGLLAVWWLLSTDRVRGLQRPALFSLGFAAVLAVVLSLSRGSWLGGGAAFVGLAAIYPHFVRRLALISVAFLVLAGTIGPLREQAVVAQQRLEDEATIASRVITNDAAIRMIGERPITGFGYGNFERFDEGYKQRVDDVPLKTGGSAHNTYLNFAVELGLPAFALYFGVPLWLLVRSLRRRDMLANARPETWQLAAVLWLVIADQFIVSNFLEMIHANLWGTALWWFTLGLICVILDRVEAEHVGGASDGRRVRAAW